MQQVPRRSGLDDQDVVDTERGQVPGDFEAREPASDDHHPTVRVVGVRSRGPLPCGETWREISCRHGGSPSWVRRVRVCGPRTTVDRDVNGTRKGVAGPRADVFPGKETRSPHGEVEGIFRLAEESLMKSLGGKATWTPAVQLYGLK
ncbi:hypothetical protein GCM10010326_61120 [Streptomyces xanthochromogenes]|uniref:Transposase n=1 Tax=Streptomyces xanthochromogenes TaxID=67384 RepID=A0ABQ3AKC8_9ACTN|nr:hypothetical protein GCM10010326_61120 [Streptomyces xanthochromogenes]